MIDCRMIDHLLDHGIADGQSPQLQRRTRRDLGRGKMRREFTARTREVTLSAVNRRMACAVVLLLTASLLLTAQNVVLTGSLSGRVTDPSGAVIPGASIVVRSLATGLEQTSETNHAGLYQFPVVMPGNYSITATLKGFRDVQVLVRVLVGSTTSQERQTAGGSERRHRQSVRHNSPVAPGGSLGQHRARALAD